jgi:hypothetical protein
VFKPNLKDGREQIAIGFNSMSRYQSPYKYSLSGIPDQIVRNLEIIIPLGPDFL